MIGHHHALPWPTRPPQPLREGAWWCESRHHVSHAYILLITTIFCPKTALNSDIGTRTHVSLCTCIETCANMHVRNHLRHLGARQHNTTCRQKGANTQSASLRLLEPVPRKRRWSEGQGVNAPMRHPRSPAAPSHHPCRVQGCCPRWGGPARLAGAAIQSPWCPPPTVAAVSCVCAYVGVLDERVFGGCRPAQTLAGVPQCVRMVCMGVVGNVGRCAASNARGCASWASCRVASRAHSSNHDTRSKAVQGRHSMYARAGHSDVRE